MSSPGRKFLLAGRGGLNLTHSEEFQRFLSRYGPAAPYLRGSMKAFAPPRSAGMVRGSGADDDLRRIERAGSFLRHSRPRRCCAHGCDNSTGLACASGRGTAGPAGAYDGALNFVGPGRIIHTAGRRHRAGAWRRELAASWLRRRLGRCAHRVGNQSNATGAGRSP